jgi:hypothetical protein
MLDFPTVFAKSLWYNKTATLSWRFGFSTLRQNRKYTMLTPQELVHAGRYPDEKTVIEEALRTLWQERPQLRINWAVYQYSGNLPDKSRRLKRENAKTEQNHPRITRIFANPFHSELRSGADPMSVTTNTTVISNK